MRVALLFLTIALVSGCGGEATSDTYAEPPEVARPYEAGVDAQRAIDAAVVRSQSDGKRVLLLFGANWCSWCRRLEHVLRNDAGVSAALASGFHLVHVDVGTRDTASNLDVVERYGDPIANGIPVFVVLDQQGGVAHVQETGGLESGDRHDPGRIVAFLERWSAAR